MSEKYDIIGDVHGCFVELVGLLSKLGYIMQSGHHFAHPDGRKVVWVGDLCDRGNLNVEVLKTVIDTVREDSGLCVLGNHDDKLRRYLKGNKIKVGHGLDITIKELESEQRSFRNDVLDFLEERPLFLKLDEDKLLVSHAGLKESLQDVVAPNKKVRGKIRAKCLYGETTGKTLDNGFPERLDWAEDYKGHRVVVHGHTVMKETSAKNNVYCVDTGAVFGGKLTALRYPEMEFVSVDSNKYAHNEVIG